MCEFASLRSYQQFEKSVKTEARFVPGAVVKEFLKTVVDTAGKHVTELAAGTILFRAQRGCRPTTETLSVYGSEEDEYEGAEIEVKAKAALSAERMVPKAEFVGDGRVNPKGIPCLYLASTKGAAISEMRPWVGEFITIAQFKTVRHLQLVDCSRNTTESWLLENVDPTMRDEEDAATKENGIWGDIGFAFSKPVTRDEPHLDYIPTQILAETFRNEGYDGIIYRSLLDKLGNNIALFDKDSATLRTCCLYEARAASFQCAKIEPFKSPTTWPDLISSDLRKMPPF